MVQTNIFPSFVDPKSSRLTKLGDGLADTALGLVKTKFQILINTPLRTGIRAFQGLIRGQKEGGPKTAAQEFIKGRNVVFNSHSYILLEI